MRTVIAGTERHMSVLRRQQSFLIIELLKIQILDEHVALATSLHAVHPAIVGVAPGPRVIVVVLGDGAVLKLGMETFLDKIYQRLY